MMMVFSQKVCQQLLCISYTCLVFNRSMEIFKVLAYEVTVLGQGKINQISLFKAIHGQDGDNPVHC